MCVGCARGSILDELSIWRDSESEKWCAPVCSRGLLRTGTSHLTPLRPARKRFVTVLHMRVKRERGEGFPDPAAAPATVTGEAAPSATG